MVRAMSSDDFRSRFLEAGFELLGRKDRLNVPMRAIRLCASIAVVSQRFDDGVVKPGT